MIFFLLGSDAWKQQLWLAAIASLILKRNLEFAFLHCQWLQSSWIPGRCTHLPQEEETGLVVASVFRLQIWCVVWSLAQTHTTNKFLGVKMKEIHFICFPQSSISGVCTSPAFRCLIGLSMGATAWLIAQYHLSPYVFDSHYTQKLVFESLWRLNKHLETCAGSQWSCHADPTTDCRALPSYSSAEVLILCLQQALHACSSLLCWHVACPRVLHRCHQTEILMHLRLLVTPVIWCEQVLARSPKWKTSRTRVQE